MTTERASLKVLMKPTKRPTRQARIAALAAETAQLEADVAHAEALGLKGLAKVAKGRLATEKSRQRQGARLTKQYRDSSDPRWNKTALPRASLASLFSPEQEIPVNPKTTPTSKASLRVLKPSKSIEKIDQPSGIAKSDSDTIRDAIKKAWRSGGEPLHKRDPKARP